MPGGKDFSNTFIAARTLLATSRALAPGSWKTATPAAGLPPTSHHWS